MDDAIGVNHMVFNIVIKGEPAEVEEDEIDAGDDAPSAPTSDSIGQLVEVGAGFANHPTNLAQLV